MSYQYADQPKCVEKEGAVELLIKPEETDLGEFTVRRALPSPERRMVGPFIFFDHMGPAVFKPGEGIQVRPHPHIGIATITFLFEGEIMHRDSLGFAQPIKAGAVNLMTAGKGIVHSERAGDDLEIESRLHGIQSWIALPDHDQECEPAFDHYPADELPKVKIDNATVTVIMGEAFGTTSPVKTFSPTLYLDCKMPSGSKITLPEGYDELALYMVSGSVTANKETINEGSMAVTCSGINMDLAAEADCHFMILGGAPVGDRNIWWNFVSNSKERIEQAKSDWENNRFDKVPGDKEFIPLPSD